MDDFVLGLALGFIGLVSECTSISILRYSGKFPGVGRGGGGNIFVIYVAEENHKNCYLHLMEKPHPLLPEPVRVWKELQKVARNKKACLILISN